jgi:hypothetical protein
MKNYLNIITLANHCGWLIKNKHSFSHAFLERIVTYAHLLAEIEFHIIWLLYFI